MIPENIGRYEIKVELGRGGMATVYRAHDPHFDRDVAIKVLPREFLHDPQFRGRFEREAHTIAALEHPAIVPVYDFGEEAGQPYLVMRFMTGGALSDQLEHGPLSPSAAAEVLAQLAPALDMAHSQGIVHRDLKPGNILFDQWDRAYISDFGIVKISEANTAYTGNALIGTPAYMSPEQARGEADIDGRSDVYSLGVIFFEMLTGQLPYESDTPMGQAISHISEPVPQILAVKAELPASCQQVITQAMAKERGARYQTAEVLATAAAGVETMEVQSGDDLDVTVMESEAATSATMLKPVMALPEPVVEPQVSGPAPGGFVAGPLVKRRASGSPAWGWALGGLILLVVLVGLGLGGTIVLPAVLDGRASPTVTAGEGVSTAPAVEIISPVDVLESLTIGQMLEVEVLATDAEGISRVELLVAEQVVDGVVAPEAQQSFNATLSWMPLAEGEYQILVVAYRQDGTASLPKHFDVRVTAGTMVTTTATPSPPRFWSAQETLASGECTTLFWEAEGALSVNLGGIPKEIVDQHEVCPFATTTYTLFVETSTGIQAYQVTVTVK